MKTKEKYWMEVFILDNIRHQICTAARQKEQERSEKEEESNDIKDG